jgi:eukaryotic-like serine/threonine-protein kinase
MATEISGALTLGEDVLVIPVADLSDESRAQIECDPGDFAVSRLRSRGGSKIIDSEAADLLSRFREPKTVVEAVILFGREKHVDPDKILEDAYPFLRSMVEAGFLVPAGQPADSVSRASPNAPHWSVGAELLGATVLRTLQLLDDTEVYLLSRPSGNRSVLKIERLSSEGQPIGSVRTRLGHEAKFLTHLGGQLAPALLGIGEVDGRSYLELDYISGVDAVTAAAEWRDREGAEARQRLLDLTCAIAKTYAVLHERGVIHGDVHFRNVLVGSDGNIRLIDLGLAGASTAVNSLPSGPERGGVPFFFEPELAGAYLAGTTAPRASEAGEQHAVAALIYFLMTGAHWQDFRLGREAMLEDIVTRVPLSFRDRGASPWPELEAVLGRALAKQPTERFPSLRAFAGALEGVPLPAAARPPARTTALRPILERALDRVGLDGLWNQTSLSPAPTTSLNYGSTGIALGLLHVAQRRRDAELLALADLWTKRALREIKNTDAFYNSEIEITPEVVGESSPYHSPSGVFAVAALVARATADPLRMAEAIAAFLDATRRPIIGLDLTLGRCSTLLGAAILLDAILANNLVDPAPMCSFGDAALAEIWQAIDAKEAIATADIEYLGIAHGWAGILYATLQWCRVSGTAVPATVERRLEELAALALPSGRGLEWPWVLHRAGEPMTMAGWCNGTCGYVFLWTLAHRLLSHPRYLDLAYGAAWRSWESSEPTVTLCCGLAGRGYALLNMYRNTGERVWLDRARDLARRSEREGYIPAEYPHSLYKGEFGLAVLAADLEEPDQAAMPFFEPMGYQI